MSRERYRRVNEIFKEACGFEGDERDAFVTRSCAGDREMEEEVRALLDCDAAEASVVDRAAEARVVSLLDTRDLEGETTPREGEDPKRVGSYDVLGRLGEGGMGVVYTALQQSPRRTVALKVIREVDPRDDGWKRFRREGEILGRLHHQGIAQVYEAGVEEMRLPSGETMYRPYLAMEYIDGQPLDDFVFDRKLSREEIIRTFAGVCDAIHYAHDQGIIHRDLKPANILVEGTGTPKILDFGIARIMDPTVTHETRAGLVLGTLAYISPEQLGGSSDTVDRRADVYSLGVILYQLFTRKLPHDVTSLSLAAAVELIRHHDPARPSLMMPLLRGDLETIVMKCLAKEPSRRYPSAEALSSDLRRFLESRPILARPPSTFYQLVKFARRNRSLVAATVLLFLALASGLLVSLGFYRTSEISRQAEAEARELAEEESAISDAVNRYLMEILTLTNPEENLDQGMLVSELLDLATEKLEGALRGQALVEGRVRATIGRAYKGQGLYERAREHIARAMAVHEELDRENLALETDHAAVLLELRELEPAEAGIRSVLERAPEGGRDYTDAVIVLGKIAVEQGSYAEAREHFRKAESTLAVLAPDDPAERAILLGSITVTHWYEQKYADAEECARGSVDLFREAYPEGHPQLASAMSTLAVILRTQGKLEEAEGLYRDALAMQRRIYGEAHPSLATTLNNMARLKEFQGKLDEAEDLFREALAMRVKFYGEDHLEVAALQTNLGFFLREKRGNLKEAESLFRTALAVRRRELGVHASVAESLIGLAKIHEVRGEFEESVKMLEEVVSIRREVFGTGYYVATGLMELGRLLDMSDDDRCVAVLQESLAAFDEKDPNQSYYRYRTIDQLFRAYLGRKQWDSAEKLALGAYEEVKGNERERKTARRRLVGLYSEWGKPEEAEKWR